MDIESLWPYYEDLQAQVKNGDLCWDLCLRKLVLKHYEIRVWNTLQ